MTTKTAAKEHVNNINKIRQEILNMRLSRIIVFADVINRYMHLRQTEYKNWLRVNTVIFLITREEKLTPSQLAKLLLRSKNSLTKLIDSLEKDGLIKRVRSGKDRRNIFIQVTAKGLDFTMAHLKKLSLLEEEIKTCLDPDELPVLVSLTRKLRLNLIEKMTGLKS